MFSFAADQKSDEKADNKVDDLSDEEQSIDLSEQSGGGPEEKVEKTEAKTEEKIEAQTSDKVAEKETVTEKDQENSLAVNGDINLDINEDLIVTPIMSRKCQELLKFREQRIKLRQKAQFLVKRVEKLLKNSPSQRKYLKKKLELVQSEIGQEIYLLTFQISSLEEDIVRKGCPGVRI